MKDIIRTTPEFKELRAKAREAIAAYEDGADLSTLKLVNLKTRQLTNLLTCKLENWKKNR